MSALTVTAADPGSRARTGLLHTAHGDVRTPAFVPLATKGSVRGLEPHEVAGLGFDMVLGNTFHLMLEPGPELIDELGGLHRFMGWDGPIITDSGGFQVFSMGYGTVADEIKGAGKKAASARAPCSTIAEAGVRFRSYVDGAERFMGPETSMEVQAALGLRHRAGLRRVHAVPRRPRLHRALDRAHAPLARALPGLARRARARAASSSTGSSRAASTRTCASSRPQASPPRACDGIAIGGSLGRRQGADVRGGRLDDGGRCREDAPAPPARHRRDRRPRRAASSSASTPSTARCRRGWAATASRSCPTPTRAGASTSRKARWRESAEPILEGCPCPACARGYSRGYLRYLLKAGELTGPAAADAAQPGVRVRA